MRNFTAFEEPTRLSPARFYLIITYVFTPQIGSYCLTSKDWNLHRLWRTVCRKRSMPPWHKLQLQRTIFASGDGRVFDSMRQLRRTPLYRLWRNVCRKRSMPTRHQLQLRRIIFASASGDGRVFSSVRQLRRTPSQKLPWPIGADFHCSLGEAERKFSLVN